MRDMRATYAIAVAVVALPALLGACTPAATSLPAPTETMAAAATATLTLTPTPTPTMVSNDPEAAPATMVQDVPYLKPLQSSVNERLLDIYIPSPDAGFPEPYPVAVFAHGYNQGKAALTTVCQDLANQGVLVFAPNWPTNPNSVASWREMTEALTCAVRFAHDSAPSYAGDPTNMVLIGFSMGAGIGAIVATNGPDLEKLWSDYATLHNGPPAQAQCVSTDASAEVQAFVGIGGAYSLVDAFQVEQPDLYGLLTTHGGTKDIRITLMHGEFDSTVPPSVSETFQAKLIAAGFIPTLISYNSGHTVPRELTVDTVVGILR